MDLQFFGANCIKLATKKATVVIDDNLSKLGAKSVAKPGDVALFTSEKLTKTDIKDPKIVIEMPGEYEVSGVSIRGISVRAHMDEEDKSTAVIYKVINTDLNVVIAGHIHPDLTDDQLEAIGMTDVLFIPVGGNGYTLDAIGALKIIKKIGPKMVIPTHYADGQLSFDVPQAKLEDALKEMTLEVKERVPKLKLKHSDLAESTELVVLEKQ